MLEDEARARLARRGVWRAGGPFQVRLSQEVASDAPGFEIVEGRLLRAAEIDGGVLLDFDQARDGFAALARAVGSAAWPWLMRIDRPSSSRWSRGASSSARLT
jgi:hypothetical protein